ncbi:hypothetical protein [Winogradskya consettensis]|uniref:hypothetical protein n=1 Tax=Winogradskya consettensis TaxID=113560 RepID=UPI001BB3CE22|nr:hypothetical protein [Actinoplanes consettensis]
MARSTVFTSLTTVSGLENRVPFVRVEALRCVPSSALDAGGDGTERAFSAV